MITERKLTLEELQTFIDVTWVILDMMYIAGDYEDNIQWRPVLKDVISTVSSYLEDFDVRVGMIQNGRERLEIIFSLVKPVLFSSRYARNLFIAACRPEKDTDITITLPDSLETATVHSLLQGTGCPKWGKYLRTM